MGAGTMALAGLLWAAAALPPDVMAMKERAIQIPIVLNRPQQVRELLLFVSTDQGKTWQQAAYATPDKQFFPFTARDDGVYWFQVCIVNQNGTREPTDLNQLKPGLVVLIDTQPPVLRLTSADKAGDDIALTWQLQEAYPELDSLKLEYRPAGDPVGQWTTVPINPGMAGQVRFRPNLTGAVQVRMSVQDSAGNQAQASQVVGTPNAVAAAPPTGGGFSPGSALPPPPAGGLVAQNEPPAPRDAPPPRDIQPAVRNEAAPSGPPPLVSSPRTDPAQHRDSASGIVPVATNSTNPAAAPRQEMRNVQLINSTQISLDYEVPRVGPSGIKSVKLYVTRDDGRSWEELADDKDLTSPITATLPGEGVFGFRLVVESGAGLSKGAPLPGDAPELRIEVDLTAPYLELYAPAPDPNSRDTLIVRWSASDKNLAPNPIMLEYATSKAGPWAPITPQPVANSGSFAWKLSQRLPYRVYVRVSAKDLAGNVGEVTSPEPQLIDLTKPEAHLIGIKSTSVQIHPDR